MRRLIQGKKITVFTGDNKRFEGKPLCMAVLDILKRNHVAGATVIRGFSGFRYGGKFHTAYSEYQMDSLPVIVEAIDEAEKIDRAVKSIYQIPDLALVEVTPITLITKEAAELNSGEEENA